ncbi:hypothetical protein GCM10022243_48140 [Saccharothrix violaceirubra]|uniref:Uncharacterized protein n=1 Tax=Saccharothrix violaceirubra TaxID=413306 RepID=A0A7W7WU48_9PSEU|nr:hypothetical protein [Saccharothrix violaceirubra]MBB4963844.1 hypothetical protein [Saccharothrix violaceirubra]
MSTYADPSKAVVWLDGDAFRAPAGTALPADIFAASLSGWEAFGGIKAGFTVQRTQEITKFTIFNANGTYLSVKGDEDGTIKMRPVDMSKATALTLLTGGSIVAAAGGYEWVKGDDEKFAYICRVSAGTRRKAYFLKKSELANIPDDVLNDEDLAGWDMEISPLIPDDGSRFIRVFTESNPLA